MMWVPVVFVALATALFLGRLTHVMLNRPRKN